MQEFNLMVGELIIRFRAGRGVSSFSLSPDHRSFLTSHGSPHCVVNVHYGPIPQVDMGNRVFESGGLWDLYRRNGRYCMPLASPVWGPEPYRLFVADASFRSGDLYICDAPSVQGDMSQNMAAGGGEGAVVDPLAYPLDEVLAVNLLAREGGINIHACGIDLEGRGVAFSGFSGAGKSTLSRLWQARGVRILSDDRLIVRQRENGFWIYGTPWHGEASFAFPGGARLESIYFLVQAPANSVRPLHRIEAVSRLLVRSFPTLYDASGMDRSLRFIAEMCQKVPCYELGFLPDSSVLDYLSGLGVAPAMAAARA